MTNLDDGLTPEEAHLRAKKGWETRRKNQALKKQQKSDYKETKKSSKKYKYGGLATNILVSILAFIIGALGAVVGFCYFTKPQSDIYVSGDLNIHFLELGNIYTGDCTYINAGGVDILIDAGSRPYDSNVTHIQQYLNQYVTDGKLEYVIVTHADQDHIACFGTSNNVQSLFDRFEIGTIIDFAKTNKDTQVYNNYVKERAEAVARGAIHYTAAQCIAETDGAQRIYELGNGIQLEILDNYYYHNKSSDENNYSVCAMINQGSKHFLFTGDLEAEGEEHFVELNPSLPEVELFKAGHHGSKTSSNDCLLDLIKPKVCAVCCCAGSDEYDAAPLNTFPTQDFINRIAKHTNKIYVTTLCTNYDAGTFTSMNGNIVVSSTRKNFEVNCSNNNTILKDTTWFQQNRTWPAYGV